MRAEQTLWCVRGKASSLALSFALHGRRTDRSYIVLWSPGVSARSFEQHAARIVRDSSRASKLLHIYLMLIVGIGPMVVAGCVCVLSVLLARAAHLHAAH